jgi:hypothetical protein
MVKALRGCTPIRRSFEPEDWDHAGVAIWATKSPCRERAAYGRYARRMLEAGRHAGREGCRGDSTFGSEEIHIKE